jgi:hypothetical protein
MSFLIAPSTTEGTFNIYNTVTNSTIACQDGGNLYTEEGNADFKLVKTSQPSITVDNGEYGTLMLPFAQVIPEDVHVYTCAKIEDNGYTLILTEVTEGGIAANVPYIVEGEWNATLTGDAKGNNSLTVTSGLLTGVYAKQDAPNGSYILQNQNDKVGFYLVNTENAKPKVPANHAYLTVPESQGANAFFFPAGGEATAITAIQALTSGNAQIFDANGVQQQRLLKGVNIVRTQEGKTVKVMVK